MPDNVWIGTSIDDNATAVQRYNDLIGYSNSNVNRFISFEPLLQNINIGNINNLEKIDWVIIGANSIPGADKPLHQWANNIMAQARNRNIPVFIKDNYGYPTSIKESPSRRNGVDIMHTSDLNSRYRYIFKVDEEFYDQSYKDMKARIKTDGFDSIPIVHVWGNYIILGHLGFEVAAELGFKEVPVQKHSFASQNEAFDYARANKDPRVEMNI